MWFLIFLISFGILLVFVELLILPGFGAAGVPGCLLILIGFSVALWKFGWPDRTDFYRDHARTGHSIGDHWTISTPENTRHSNFYPECNRK